MKVTRVGTISYQHNHSIVNSEHAHTSVCTTLSHMFYYEVYIHTTQLAIVHTQIQQKINVLELTLAHTHTINIFKLNCKERRGRKRGEKEGRKGKRERSILIRNQTEYGHADNNNDLSLRIKLRGFCFYW